MCIVMHAKQPRRTSTSLKRSLQRGVVQVLDAGLLRALAEPARLELVKMLLLYGPQDINSVARRLPQDRSVLSRHLQVLQRAGVVECTKEGRHRVYRLRGAEVVARLESMVREVRDLVDACCGDPALKQG